MNANLLLSSSLDFPPFQFQRLLGLLLHFQLPPPVFAFLPITLKTTKLNGGLK
jgi:hypothetical protein